MSEYGLRYDENGDPLIKDCVKNNFAGYYPSPESMSAFERLYENIDGVQDAFVAYWDAVSKHYATNPYVIGYDPLNEPFPSNFYKDPTLVIEHWRFD